jgi:hypothetical protein
MMRRQKSSGSAFRSSETARMEASDIPPLSPVMVFLGFGILLALLLFS